MGANCAACLGDNPEPRTTISATKEEKSGGVHAGVESHDDYSQNVQIEHAVELVLDDGQQGADLSAKAAAKGYL